MSEIRKIKSKERQRAGNIYCDYCKPKKVDAIYRKVGFASHDSGDFACEEHRDKIKVEIEKGLSEADYQTWMKL